MTPNELAAYADVMTAKGIVELTVGNVHIKLSQSLPVHTMTVPPAQPKEVPPAVKELFRELTDEELLLMSSAPLAQPEASQ